MALCPDQGLSNYGGKLNEVKIEMDMMYTLEDYAALLEMEL